MKMVLLFIMVANGCVMNRLSTTPETINLNKGEAAQHITLNVTVGSQYATRMQAGPFIFNVLPQFALWVEDERGRFIETLYVSGADGKGMRHAEKNKLQADFYRKYLPVWATRAAGAGQHLPSKDAPYADAITSATPTTHFTLNLPLTNAELIALVGTAAPPPTVLVFLEINRSGDFNETFTAETTDGVGQPSVIYRASMPWLPAAAPVELRMVGHGGTMGQQPRIHQEVSGLDTALQMVERATVGFGR